jgi:hypothetical protein
MLKINGKGKQMKNYNKYFVKNCYNHLLALQKNNNEKGEGLQTNLQPFTYLYCNTSFSLQY